MNAFGNTTSIRSTLPKEAGGLKNEKSKKKRSAQLYMRRPDFLFNGVEAAEGEGRTVGGFNKRAASYVLFVACRESLLSKGSEAARGS